MPYRRVPKVHRADQTCTVYLLHFTVPLAHARHYIGVCGPERALADRLAEHGKGKGARICRYAVAAGAELVLARVWEGVPRTFEQVLKNRGGAGRLCPLCREERNHGGEQGDGGRGAQDLAALLDTGSGGADGERAAPGPRQ